MDNSKIAASLNKESKKAKKTRKKKKKKKQTTTVLTQICERNKNLFASTRPDYALRIRIMATDKSRDFTINYKDMSHIPL